MTLQEFIEAAAKHNCNPDAEILIDCGEGADSLDVEKDIKFDDGVITIEFFVW